MDERDADSILRHVKAEETGETLKVELLQGIHVRTKILKFLVPSALQYFIWKGTLSIQY